MAFNSYAWGNDGGTYGEDSMRDLVYALSGGQAGVVGPSTALQVSQQAAPAATVRVAAGGFVIPATAAGETGSYTDYNDGYLTSPAFTPTGVGVSRKDRVIIRVTAGVSAVEIVQGTAAASPTEPSITGDNYLELALVTLPASTSNITDAMITDRRVFLTTGISGEEWTTYSPTLAWSGGGGSIGNGSLTGRYQKVGRTVHFEALLTYGSTTVSGTGRLRIGLPVASSANKSRNGGGSCEDVGTQEYACGMAIPASVSYCEMPLSTGYVSPTSPFTFASGDIVAVGGTFEAAS